MNYCNKKKRRNTYFIVKPLVGCTSCSYFICKTSQPPIPLNAKKKQQRSHNHGNATSFGTQKKQTTLRERERERAEMQRIHESRSRRKEMRSGARISAINQGRKFSNSCFRFGIKVRISKNGFRKFSHLICLSDTQTTGFQKNPNLIDTLSLYKAFFPFFFLSLSLKTPTCTATIYDELMKVLFFPFMQLIFTPSTKISYNLQIEIWVSHSFHQILLLVFSSTPQIVIIWILGISN